MDDVKVGQVGADNDKRSACRHVLVVSIDETHATVELCTSQGSPLTFRGRSKTTRIRLDRFRPTSTGYRLVTGGA